MQLEISSDERDLLRKITERALSEIRVEVRRTDTPSYHDELKAEEALLDALLARLSAD
jgi:hypothetical protein